MWNPLPLSQACKTNGSTYTVCLVPSLRLSKPPQPSQQMHQCKQGEGGDFTALCEHHNQKTDHYVHSARSKVGLGSQSLVCNTLVQHVHPHFIVFLFWPLIMISRTWERSIILVSISMMSGCSLAPLMNSSSVNSPGVTSRKKRHQNQPGKTKPTAEEMLGQNQDSLPSPLTSILSYIRVTISSGGISYVLVISWIAWQKECNCYISQLHCT